MSQLEIKMGDITQFHGDAIVNAANRQLLGGGGVDGAIHRAAGKQQLNQACAKLNGCPTGEAKFTPGFNLPVQYIIHTVGPIWQGVSFEEAKLLKSAYYNSLRLAQQLNCHSIAFPSISTGVYRYPIHQAAKIAIETINQFPAKIKVTMICFDKQTYQVYQQSKTELQ